MAVDVITLLTSIAALITAVAALLTLREMREQRRSAYHPEIVGVGCRFTANRDDRPKYRWRGRMIGLSVGKLAISVLP